MLFTLLRAIKCRVNYLIKKKYDLVIIDDAFPHLLSGFRVAEFNTYIQNFKRIRIYSTGKAFKALNEEGDYKDVLEKYRKLFPKYVKKITFYKEQQLKAKLAYFIFLNNADNYLGEINKYKIPFVFTLYPGGGFQLNNEEVDAKLKRVMSSPYFRHVIVTTTTTKDYLLKKQFCSADRIQFIYGVVLPSTYYLNNAALKVKYKVEKQQLDICFVAHKYTPKGTDKGYDTFIATAHALAKQVSDVHFHVVGNFNSRDIDITAIEEKITFYSTLTTTDFSSFYAGMDIILSPNKSFLLNPGGFDGFPTGACIEAGLNGVALFVADDLKQNIYFKHHENVVFIDGNNPDLIASEILYYREHISSLYELATKGKEIIAKVYNIDTQMRQRLEVIKQYMV